MEKDQNLALDRGVNRQLGEVVRISVELACGYTQAAAPTVSEDCASYAQLAREVERLKGELDEALDEAAKWFGGREAGERRAEADARAAAVAGDEADTAVGEGSPGIATELRVRDVMTREVKTLQPTDELSLADELMKVGRFRHVVAVDDGGEVAGVVSHRDIFHSAIAWTMGQGRYAHDKALAAALVKDVMQSDVATTAPDVPLQEAAKQMSEQKIGCLPVVDGDAGLVGILTEGDFLALLSQG